MSNRPQLPLLPQREGREEEEEREQVVATAVVDSSVYVCMYVCACVLCEGERHVCSVRGEANSFHNL